MLMTAKEAERLDFDWGIIRWVASEALGNSEHMTVGMVTIKSGEGNPVHRHPNCEEILHLLSGKLDHMLEGKVFAMSPGDTITIPAGAWHNARAVGGEDASMVVCFSSADRQTEMRGSGVG
ncbi:MAG TPA: cupin domain-containing protein [Capsulimonadaceae bacterium]|nr:cupin domain-containing protein [Capsulimonadaceae bacterium]